MVCPGPRPEFPGLPSKECKANGTANKTRGGASFVLSAVETGKLQERRNSLRMGMQQLTALNKKMRAAVNECKHGIIKGYPDLEITNINKFIRDHLGLTETLLVKVDSAVESFAGSPKSRMEMASVLS